MAGKGERNGKINKDCGAEYSVPTDRTEIIWGCGGNKKPHICPTGIVSMQKEKTM